MAQKPSRRLSGLRLILRQTLSGPQALAFLPALVLAAFWLGGEGWLILAALALPLLYAFIGGFSPRAEDAPPRDSTTGLPLREALEAALDDRMEMARARGRGTGCFLIALDDFDDIADRYGSAAAEEVLARTADRLCAAMRAGDLVCRTGPDRFGVALATVSHLDLEIAIQVAARLQSAVEEPLALGATPVYLSCSIGFCLGTRAPEPTGRGVLSAAECALDEARVNAPSAIRAFAPEMTRRSYPQPVGTEEVTAALDAGQIVPFFQPQISTDTGRVTGFEALARWCHPDRGVILPADFLPALEAAGQMGRLGEVVLTHACRALKAWDEAGLDIPCVGVNFSPTELRDPKLIDKIRWQLDRFDFAPGRLVVEVLETVVAASPEDTVVRNVNGLADLGCRVDLDDFGTGHASISSMRRFAVSRLKVDRSFVMKVDRDVEQQKMVSAILTLADRLGLDTLAEGVETRGEHTMLAQLGCRHVQGFCIGRPMPAEQTVDWVRAHEADLNTPPRIGRQAG
ncbi:putative bifunctional diguanylate cyclase/phosphodiesterase [Pseudooceanicola sp.]|uniref:putative bifunctional diguanylate cyclase/phosphodiesterase n=1 Tax=Pseudooceanicola sp. TaxID=1914328 RepID=UPI004059A8AD